MGAQAVRLSNVDIDNALKNRDFEVLFQPIFDLGNGALARMETFVRWRHKSLGLLPPGAFISFFETQGRMSELTRYVLAEALNAYLDWRGPYAPGLSINLALSDLSDDAFASHFTKLLRDTGFPADLVTLECPMPPVDADSDAAAGHFQKLSDTGARLAIEVRGRANEFLREVDPFPFDEIKTGGSSILRFARTVRGPGLSAIADLLDIANKANAAITAVGVEDQASLAALRGLGFTAAQGNHLAKVGDLKDFKPGQVNDVRALLGLDALNTESLNALFRTESPTLQTESAQKTQASVKSKMPESESADAAAPEDRKAKARAMALAKRAKTRETRKAAAIERVKAKAAQSTAVEAPDAKASPAADPFEPRQAPRDLQKRLNEEFSSSVQTGKADEQETSPPLEAPEADSPPVKKQPKAAPRKTSAAKPSSPAARPAPPKARPAPPASLLSEPQAETAKQKPGSLAPKKSAPAPSETTSQTELPLPAASGQQDEKQAKPAASEKKPGLTALKMPVSAAGAKFVPVIRVSGPDKDGKALGMRQPTAEPAQTEQAPKPPAPAEPAVEDDTLDVFFDPAPEEKPHAGDAKTNAPEPSLTPPVADGETEIGDLHRDVESDPVAPRRTRKSKNFLTRKYRLMPTHFWPKSWKRQFRKMQAKKEAARQATAEPASAD